MRAAMKFCTSVSGNTGGQSLGQHHGLRDRAGVDSVLISTCQLVEVVTYDWMKVLSWVKLIAGETRNDRGARDRPRAREHLRLTGG